MPGMPKLEETVEQQRVALNEVGKTVMEMARAIMELWRYTLDQEKRIKELEEK